MDSENYKPFINGEQERAYCGPTILMMLTGFPLQKVRRDINLLKRRQGYKSQKAYKNGGGYRLEPWRLSNPVKGMTNRLMTLMLDSYKMRAEHHRVTGRKQSLKTFVDDWAAVKEPVVINSGHHYVLFYHGMIYDNFRPGGELAESHHSANTRVVEYWVIRRTKPFNIGWVSEAGTTKVEKPEPKTPKKSIQQVRYEKAAAKLKDWETKKKRADNAVKKWRKKVRYYEKVFAKKSEI